MAGGARGPTSIFAMPEGDMAGCCGSTSCGIGRCFGHFSHRYTRRYERRGLEDTQRHLIAGLSAVGFAGRSLLEIGCGVGYLHQYLVLHGAATAVGVDLAWPMLIEARALAARQGLAQRVRYVSGDFQDLAPALDTADITLLDKVVCCYPDAAGLIAATLARTREACALTLPRRHAFNRVAAHLGAGLFCAVGSRYRPFVHDPAMIDRQMRAAGLAPVFEARTRIWLTRIYRRALAPAGG